MAKSIMPFNIKGRCYICKANCPTETHHIFQGSNRQACDDLGLTVDICRICHERAHKYPKISSEIKCSKNSNDNTRSLYRPMERDFQKRLQRLRRNA